MRRGAPGPRPANRPATRTGARPSAHAAAAGPCSAALRRPRPCSPRIRRVPGRHRGRRPEPGRAGARQPCAGRRADPDARRAGSRRTGAAGATTGARSGHRYREVRRRRSRRETLTTLAAARGENRTPGAGAHPKAEAVLPVPATVIRLERPLAHWNDSGTCLDNDVWLRSTGPRKRTCPWNFESAIVEKPGPSPSAAQNGRLNADRSTVRGRPMPGQTGTVSDELTESTNTHSQYGQPDTPEVAPKSDPKPVDDGLLGLSSPC